MSNLDGKADADIRREMQLAARAHDLSKAKPLKQLAWEAIQNGSDPAYIAMRYGFPVEEMQRAKAVHEAREAERLARANRGNES